MPDQSQHDHILIIKLGALGDFVQALGPMAAIRRHHPQARITLLTTAPFRELAEKSGYIDHIIIDPRPRWHEWGKWNALKAALIGGRFARVYDLQNNDRTRLYFRLFPKKDRPEWVGTAKSASHCNNAPARTAGHAFDGHRQTLSLAGIYDIQIDNLSWATADTGPFKLPKDYALIVPGCAPSRPEKQWPAKHYAHLCAWLVKKGLTPVIIGTEAERETARTIKAICAEARDLTEQTTITDIAVLARHARIATGNDTGPMHIIAATGCPSLTLFSPHSNPLKHAPLGRRAEIIQSVDLDTLSSEDVSRRIAKML